MGNLWIFSPQDKVRTESYRDFMYRNPEVFRDKVSQMNKCKQICMYLMCVYSMCRVADLMYGQAY